MIRRIRFPLFFHESKEEIQLNWTKRFYKAKQNRGFGEKVQDCKDGSGLQFINFDLVTGSQEIKVYFASLVNMSSRSSQ